jgi:glycosyltransferase involved in cell wall biosynthesis
MSKGLDSPTISIITIAKNNELGLEKTLGSILEQDFSSWELIIVIGKSDDRTEIIANNFQSTFQRIIVVIQKDTGIYEAMNLGVREVQTDYIWFMNAGDTFNNAESLRIGALEASKHDRGLLIGHHQIQGSDRLFNNPIGPIKKQRLAFSRRGNCHQAMIFKASYLTGKPAFDVNYRFAADYKLALRVVGLGGGYRIPEVICKVEPGGVSDVNLSEVHREKHHIRLEILGESLWLRGFSRFWIFLLFTKVRTRKIMEKLLRLNR